MPDPDDDDDDILYCGPPPREGPPTLGEVVVHFIVPRTEANLNARGASSAARVEAVIDQDTVDLIDVAPNPNAQVTEGPMQPDWFVVRPGAVVTRCTRSRGQTDQPHTFDFILV